MSDDWSRDEVELIVADYFEMLRAELSGGQVNKAAHNRRLQQEISRSKASIEFKHSNISAVLLNLGDFPYIDGYKPLGNYQQLLEQVVLERLDIEPDFFERLAGSAIVRPVQRAKTDFGDLEDLVESAPEPVEASEMPRRSGATRQLTPGARWTDFVRLDAENRKLGRMGEEWVLEFEARRLTDLGRRPDLARKVTWVSRDEGDNLGFDIRSYEADENPRLIEVKTTGLAKYHPFYVSPNEVAVSEREATRYYLYRVFDFARTPRLYMLQGAFPSTCSLEPAQFLARFARP